MEKTVDQPETLRDAEAVVRLLGEGFAGLDATTDIRPALECLYTLATHNRPIPWPGLVLDLGELFAGREVARFQRASPDGRTPPLLRHYEDRVLGKLYTDPLLDRMVDAVLAAGPERRAEALAFAIHQVCERLKLPAVIVSPGVLRSELDQPMRERLASIGQRALADGFNPLASHLLKGLTYRVRMADSFFRLEDVLALEQGTALLPFAQFIAHRQILESSRHFQERVKLPLRRADRARQIASNLHDEDQYPIGGYSSIATKGAIESLLHSQLAYMDPPGAHRPDFFDVKYLRDELFYYARDENEFHRRRRSFWFVLHPSLVAARQKDPDAPAQRIMIALGFIDALVHQLTERLNQEFLHFHILFLGESKSLALQSEWELLELLFGDGIQRGDIQLERRSHEDGLAALEESRKRIATDLLFLTGEDDSAFEERLVVDVETPRLLPGRNKSDSGGLQRWSEIYGTVLSKWLS